jgi:antitoxin HicB
MSYLRSNSAHIILRRPHPDAARIKCVTALLSVQRKLMLTYPLKLTPDSNGTLLVTFTDVPNANAVGNDVENAKASALDALETAFSMYVDQSKAIPLPSVATTNQIELAIPSLTTARVLLWNRVVADNTGVAELARRLTLPLSDIQELFDFTRAAPPDLVERAAAALGIRVGPSQA